MPPTACERLEGRALLAAAPPAPVVSLVQDTGISPTDRITSVGMLSVATAPGASAEYSTDGTSWSATFTPQAGLNKVRVRQALPDSGPSAATAFSFTFDTSAAPLAVSLKADTGAFSTDRVTKDGTLSFIDPVTKKTTVESGATVQFKQGESDWGAAFTSVEGVNMVKVRQVDRAGNPSAESTLEFTLDKTAPVAPAASLANDTNVPDDRVTSDGTLLTATTGPNAIEGNATVQYSVNGGKTWSNTLSPKSGANAVLVRQVDLAGNASAATSIAFTYDNTAPARPVVALLADTGASKTDRITSDGTLSFANPSTKKSSLETAATVQYSVLQNDGVTWSEWALSFTPVEGANSVKARQTDTAGNVSAESQPLAFTLMKQPPTITAVTAPAAKTYASGQVLEFTVSYSRPVTVSPLSGGTAVPYLDLTIGGSSRRATYAGGSGTATLVFRATVPAGSYGAVAAAGAIGLPAKAFIRDLAGNAGPASFSVPDVGGILVDAVVPVASLSFDPLTKSATIAFSRPVTGVDLADFRIKGSVSGTNFNLPLTDPLVINQVGNVSVSGSGGLWKLTVDSLPTAAGSFTLVLVAAGSGIVDAVGNTLLADASLSLTR